MVNRCCRTVFQAPTISPPRVSSPGQSHRRSGSSKPRDAMNEGVHVPMEPETKVESRREGRTLRSGRLISHRTMRDVNIARMVEIILENQQQMKEIHMAIAQFKKQLTEELSESANTPMMLSPPNVAFTSAWPR